jgi:hypothetical protein
MTIEILHSTTSIKGKIGWPGRILNFKARIACQDVLLQKGFDLNNKPKSRIRCVCYGLKCCMEVRFSKITSSGRSLQERDWRLNTNLHSKIAMRVNDYGEKYA